MTTLTLSHDGEHVGTIDGLTQHSAFKVKALAESAGLQADYVSRDENTTVSRDDVRLALQRVGLKADDVAAGDGQVQVTFSADEWVKVRRLLIFGSTAQAELDRHA